MAIIDKNYNKLINVILSDGFIYEDPNRKGINRIQIPSYKFEHDFKNGFPAITTKKLYWKGVVGELMWFLKGDTNIKYLLENKIPIWNKDAYNYFLKDNPLLTRCIGPDNCQDIPFSVDNPQHLDLFLGETLSGKSNTGDLGRVYGAQWRNWQDNGNHSINLIPSQFKDGVSTEELIEEWKRTVRETGLSFVNSMDKVSISVDQISNLIKGLKETPMGTRHMVTAWNPAELDNMALPPCHWSFEVLVEPIKFWERVDLLYKPGAISTSGDLTLVEEELNERNVPKYKFTLKWHQRSVDTFLGLPFNIASYALLAQIIGKMVNMIPKGIEGDLSNVHLYEPHLKAVEKQLNRNIDEYGPCQLTMLDEFHYLTDKELVGNLSVNEIIDNLRIDMFKLKDYKSYPAIKAKMLPYSS